MGIIDLSSVVGTRCERGLIEIFYCKGGRDKSGPDYVYYPPGWYWCLISPRKSSDIDPNGPFVTKELTLADAQKGE